MPDASSRDSRKQRHIINGKQKISFGLRFVDRVAPGSLAAHPWRDWLRQASVAERRKTPAIRCPSVMDDTTDEEKPNNAETSQLLRLSAIGLTLACAHVI